MSLFDMPSVSGGGSWQGLLTEVSKAGLGIYRGQLEKKQVRRSTRAMRGSISQRPGWGGASVYGGGAPIRYGGPGGVQTLRLGLGENLPVPYGGGRAPSSLESLGGLIGSAGKIWDAISKGSPSMPAGGPRPFDDGYDPTPGPWAADDPYSQDYQSGSPRDLETYVDKCGVVRTRRVRMPNTYQIGDVVYVKRGRPVLYAADLSTVKRVQNVAARCQAAISGKCAPRRRRASKKRRRGARRKVACRTLSPAQLAAGFGGAQYKR